MAAFLMSVEEGIPLDSLISAAFAADTVLTAPSMLWFEWLNALVVAEKRGRIDRQQAVQLREEASRLPISVELPPGSLERRRIHEYALTHNLTAYDAAYLELAERSGARLKTLDDDLLALRSVYPWIE